MPSTSGFQPWWKRWCSQNKSRCNGETFSKGFQLSGRQVGFSPNPHFRTLEVLGSGYGSLTSWKRRRIC